MVREAVRDARYALSRETYPVRALMRQSIRRGPRLRTRTDLLNHLIRRHRYKRYLEIGVSGRANFDRVRAHTKHGVDPAPRRAVSHEMTSDEFFSRMWRSSGVTYYDLVFIDGAHLAEQVKRDIENALESLSPSGTIVLHDCNPQSEEAQLETYDGVSLWNGSVWRAWVEFRARRPDLSMVVVDIDQGCGVIRRGKQMCYPLAASPAELDYAFLDRHRREMLNLVGPDDFIDNPDVASR